MKNIEYQGSVISGLEVSLTALIEAGVSISQLNLIFSDANNLYVFGGENGLSITESDEYFAVMTLPP